MPAQKNYFFWLKLFMFILGVLLIVLGTILAYNFYLSQTRPEQPISANLEAEKTVSVVDEESAVIEAVEAASPAVVSIVISQDVPVFEEYYYNPFGGTDMFFGFPRYRQKGTEKQQVSAGSGFIVSADGLIVTNKHVVTDETAEYTVITGQGDKYEAEIIDKDPTTDLAILKIDAGNLAYLELADSDDLKVGQTAIAIGYALGKFDNTVTKGVVSGLSRSIMAGGNSMGLENLEGVIQTDAAINPGNSGGPLLNLAGQVIGVNVAVASGVENIGFALPSNFVSSIIQNIAENGEIVRPYLGIRYMMITPEIKEANNLEVDSGALIVRGQEPTELAVMPGSPADKADLREGDIILKIGGKEIKQGQSLASLMRQYRVSEQVEMEILSKGETKNVSVTLEAWPE